jgi:hypothetical protein
MDVRKQNWGTEMSFTICSPVLQKMLLSDQSKQKEVGHSAGIGADEKDKHNFIQQN